MKISEVGFRVVYKSFAVFPIGDFEESVKDYLGVEDANCMLTYGYIDVEQGLTLEVIALGKQKGDSAVFFDSCDDRRFFIRAGAVINEEFVAIGNGIEEFKERYSDKIDIIAYYDAEDDVEITRTWNKIDKIRHPEFPDDVLVGIMKEGLQPEGCWVRIKELNEGKIMGTLLNEPTQDFGCHEGDLIPFKLFEKKDGSIAAASYFK
ncbi:hypothetical protein [Eubacterium ventriosum]|jgi:hypothetical protein|uniref:hypothetical protein n=1 Tax=Eubacterium ventriosum TaxID=39496 RepID=UPI00243274F5|nr:hypothetical protein [Eubacterium ventriosum]